MYHCHVLLIFSMGCANGKELQNTDIGSNKIDLLPQLEAGTLTEKHSIVDNFTEIKPDPISQKVPKYKTQIDSRVTSKYDIKALVGKGSFSDVLRVEAKTSHQPYAIKIVKIRTIQEKEVIKSEIDALRVLEHPFVVQLVDVIEAADCSYLVMELATGGELYDKIKSRGRLDEKYTCNITQMLVNGLTYLHSKNIIHRDLKPENLLFYHPGQDSKILITDFGFSKHVKEGEFSRTWCGTPEYIAPELILKEPYCKKVDIWALGVIVFVMLSGHLPFSADTTPKLFKQIIEGSFSFSREVWQSVSTAAKDFITKLLQIDTVERLDINQASKHAWMSAYPVMHKPKISKHRRRTRLKHQRSSVSDINSVGTKRLSIDYPDTIQSENTESYISNLLREKRNNQLNKGIVLPFSGAYSGDVLTKDLILDDNASSLSPNNVDSLRATEDTNSVMSSNVDLLRQFSSKYNSTTDPVIRQQMKEFYERALHGNNLQLPVQFSSQINDGNIILPSTLSSNMKESVYDQFEIIDEDSEDEIQITRFTDKQTNNDSLRNTTMPNESEKVRYIEKVGVWLNQENGRKDENTNYVSSEDIDPDNLFNRRTISGKSAATTATDHSQASSFNRFLLPTQSRKQIQKKSSLLSQTSSQHSRISSNYPATEILETSFSSSSSHITTPLMFRQGRTGTSFA